MSEDLRVGLFPVRYNVGTGLPGAPQLALNLVVDTTERSVVGTATISQAVSPPLNFRAEVWGTYVFRLGPPPRRDGRGAIVQISLQGGQIGQAGQGTPFITFYAELLLRGDGKSGVASYRYYSNGTWHEVENVPVKADPEVVPLEPGPVILEAARSAYGPMPMYAATIQYAAVSGDLAHMKTLASYARQQLESRDDIAAALKTLKAEIAKLESRQ
ncbi:DUF1842 domain-containing protein [Burkholderia oklahomensis]|uniref:DUF1842 domain-containing protein n=1 Tax=Burkholderia oklahomensis TaxID=342113 RepID=A0AAI8BB73_9BURK|nr:DUF1842 domain-containing protein [Burkholderia oklahomensis]AIO68948.1 hypothetical protein DM82_4216 [Burkholderia oklahomensis]AOI40232.1 hypothetical protein WG70_11795 [Burkholderia oklahomensis EO147]KUY48794.1 hypothetical protein WG70_21735 [Burkholderia oklahomensis EO147]QPS39400.1 DUF1842 domain-containing protein [Burkholderia oklahomensis]